MDNYAKFTIDTPFGAVELIYRGSVSHRIIREAISSDIDKFAKAATVAIALAELDAIKQPGNS